MTTTTFDRLAYIDTLKASGIEEAQARAFAGALDAALKDTVATRQDVATLEHHLDLRIAELKADILKWLFGLLLGQAALIGALIKLL